jgi:putative endonuclease
MFYTYILKSEKDTTYYIGTTGNLTNRLNEHNFGNTTYTKRKRPWILLYSEEFPTRGFAILREKQLKRIKNRTVLEKIIGEGQAQW